MSISCLFTFSLSLLKRAHTYLVAHRCRRRRRRRCCNGEWKSSSSCLTLSFPYSFTHIISLSLSLSLSHTHTETYTQCQSLSPSNTLFSLSLSLSHGPSAKRIRRATEQPRTRCPLDSSLSLPSRSRFETRPCDQIGLFLKGLGNKFAYKSSPKRLLTFGLF